MAEGRGIISSRMRLKTTLAGKEPDRLPPSHSDRNGHSQDCRRRVRKGFAAENAYTGGSGPRTETVR